MHSFLVCSKSILMSADQKLAKGVAHTAVKNALQKVDAPGPDGGLVLLQSAQVQGDWPPLLPRRMQPVDPGAAVSGADELLKVMQFNVLADGLSANCEGKGGFTLIPHEGLVRDTASQLQSTAFHRLSSWSAQEW